MRIRVFIILFIAFIGINLIPNFLLLFTERYSIIDGLLSLLIPAALYTLLLSIFPRLGIMLLILIPKYILDAFQLVILYLFGESVIAVDMFLNLATTNASEATELLRNLMPAIIGVCILYIPVIFGAGFCFYKKYSIRYRLRHRVRSISAITLGVCLFTLPFTTSLFSIRNMVYPINVIYNMRLAIQKWNISLHYPERTKAFKFNAYRSDSLTSREIYVLVIGEASRAENWQLGGYERPTNPLLKKRNNLVYFPDALTQSNTTHKSVPLILSPANATNIQELYQSRSVISAVREAGFKTLFISNQVPNRSFTDYFAAEADRTIFIRQGNLITENRYDLDMIDSCRQFIDTCNHNLFIIIHTYGSHFKYNERYNSKFSYFRPDHLTDISVKQRQELINSYDNSIRYTDYFLDTLIQLLEKKACSALLYCSDHGEDLLDDKRKRFLHASPTPTYYQIHIPLFLWFSDTYQIKFPEKVTSAFQNRVQSVSTANVFHTLLDLTSIHCKQWKSHYSLLSPYFIQSQRYYLTDHDQAVPFSSCGLRQMDLIKLKNRGIRLDLNNNE